MVMGEVKKFLGSKSAEGGPEAPSNPHEGGVPDGTERGAGDVRKFVPRKPAAPIERLHAEERDDFDVQLDRLTRIMTEDDIRRAVKRSPDLSVAVNRFHTMYETVHSLTHSVSPGRRERLLAESMRIVKEYSNAALAHWIDTSTEMQWTRRPMFFAAILAEYRSRTKGPEKNSPPSEEPHE